MKDHKLDLQRGRNVTSRYQEEKRMQLQIKSESGKLYMVLE